MITHQLPCRWKVTTLGDIAQIEFSSVDKKTRPSERPIRICNYVDVFHNSFITRELPFMEATATPSEISRFQLRKGHVVFTKNSEIPDEIAVPAYVVEDLPEVICGYHLGIARPKRGIDGQFLYFALKNSLVRSQFAKVANGVTRFGLTLEATNSVRIAVPPMSEQVRIADILATWDRGFQQRDVQEIVLNSFASALQMRGFISGALRCGHLVTCSPQIARKRSKQMDHSGLLESAATGRAHSSASMTWLFWEATRRFIAWNLAVS